MSVFAREVGYTVNKFFNSMFFGNPGDRVFKFDKQFNPIEFK